MVNALTRYAEARARYDTTYIRGVYASVEAASSQFKISTNATWPGVSAAPLVMYGVFVFVVHHDLQNNVGATLSTRVSCTIAGRHGLGRRRGLLERSPGDQQGSRSTQWRRSTTRAMCPMCIARPAFCVRTGGLFRPQGACRTRSPD